MHRLQRSPSRSGQRERRERESEIVRHPAPMPVHIATDDAPQCHEPAGDPKQGQGAESGARPRTAECMEGKYQSAQAPDGNAQHQRHRRTEDMQADHGPVVFGEPVADLRVKRAAQRPHGVGERQQRQQRLASTWRQQGKNPSSGQKRVFVYSLSWPYDSD